MKLDLEHILDKFKLYSGEAMDGREPGRDALCQNLCQECMDWALGQIRSDAGQSGASGVESLAAAEAFYQLALLDQSAGPETVSSPELKVELGGRTEHAKRLCQEKREGCRNVLISDGFYFGRA